MKSLYMYSWGWRMEYCLLYMFTHSQDRDITIVNTFSLGEDSHIYYSHLTIISKSIIM